jgi:hypothetical protein
VADKRTHGYEHTHPSARQTSTITFIVSHPKHLYIGGISPWPWQFHDRPTQQPSAVFSRDCDIAFPAEHEEKVDTTWGIQKLSFLSIFTTRSFQAICGWVELEHKFSLVHSVQRQNPTARQPLVPCNPSASQLPVHRKKTVHRQKKSTPPPDALAFEMISSEEELRRPGELWLVRSGSR